MKKIPNKYWLVLKLPKRSVESHKIGRTKHSGAVKKVEKIFDNSYFPGTIGEFNLD